MTIIASDVETMYPELSNDLSTNGGRMTLNVCASDVAENVWPHVREAERQSGSNKYRKRFHRIKNADNLPYPDFHIGIAAPTPGDDMLFCFQGTQTDTQNDLTGSENLFGAGALDTALVGGGSETTVDVLVEDWATYPVFRNGEKVMIHNGYYSLVGSSYVWTAPTVQELFTISGAPSPAGNVITLTLNTPVVSAFSVGQCNVCSMINYGDLKATLTNEIVTSAAGTFNNSQLTLVHASAIEQVVTLTFTNATDFNASSDVGGSLGSGNVLSTFLASDGSHSIPSAAWGGTFAGGDTVQYTLHPASVALWERRVVPALASTINAFSRRIARWGQSA